MEVNGVEVTGRSQSEVAGLLRQIPIGGTATLTVSRQEQRNGDTSGSAAESFSETEKPPSPKLPRQLVRAEFFLSFSLRLIYSWYIGFLNFFGLSLELQVFRIVAISSASIRISVPFSHHCLL